MRILVTCDRRLAPLQEGLVLRIHHYVRLLRERHEFDLVCLDSASDIPYVPTEGFFQRVVRVPINPLRRRVGLARITAAFSADDLYVQSAAAKQAIESLVSERRHDLIWDAGANMMNCLVDVRRTVPLLADQVDDTFVAIRRQFTRASTLHQKLWFAKHLWLQRRFARRHLTPAAAVLFVSDLDEASFRTVCPDAKTVSIANGVDETYFQPGVDWSETPSSPTIVFEGVMRFEPNVDAVLHLVQDIMPALRTAIPGLTLYVVGRDPVQEVCALACDDVVVTGFVDDVRPWLARADVFVCPMRLGAGIKNKILQAWAMGMAVVSTPEGAHGLDAHDGVNIVIRAGAEEFSRAVQDLLIDSARRRRIGAAARATVDSQYAWSAKARELEFLFERILKNSGDSLVV